MLTKNEQLVDDERAELLADIRRTKRFIKKLQAMKSSTLWIVTQVYGGVIAAHTMEPDPEARPEGPPFLDDCGSIKFEGYFEDEEKALKLARRLSWKNRETVYSVDTTSRQGILDYENMYLKEQEDKARGLHGPLDS